MGMNIEPHRYDAEFWRSEASHALSAGAPLDRAPGASILVQTSGSEGLPKWVVLGKRAFLVSAEAVNAHLEATAEDRWLIALPTHHVGGFSIHARAYVAGCGLAHFEGRWDALRFAQTCERECISLTSLVPTQVFDLVQQRLEAPKGLRAIVVGGGGLSRDIGQRAIELGWPVLQSFGMTEACSQIATEPLDHLYTGFDPDALEVLPHWQLETDQDGLLVIRGEALASGYLVEQQHDWLWQPIEGVLHTRDRVQFWQHGTRWFLRFLGREAQTLKILGELVPLPPLQARLETLALQRGITARCVIVPVEDERRGSALILVSTAEPAGLLEAFNTQVQPFERLQRFERVSHLPVSDLGKIKWQELLEQLRG